MGLDRSGFAVLEKRSASPAATFEGRAWPGHAGQGKADDLRDNSAWWPGCHPDAGERQAGHDCPTHSADDRSRNASLYLYCNRFNVSGCVICDSGQSDRVGIPDTSLIQRLICRPRQHCAVMSKNTIHSPFRRSPIEVAAPPSFIGWTTHDRSVEFLIHQLGEVIVHPSRSLLLQTLSEFIRNQEAEHMIQFVVMVKPSSLGIDISDRIVPGRRPGREAILRPAQPPGEHGSPDVDVPLVETVWRFHLTSAPNRCMASTAAAGSPRWPCTSGRSATPRYAAARG